MNTNRELANLFREMARMLELEGVKWKMLSLRRIGDDSAALQNAFDGFNRWGNVRGVFQVLAFGANIWSLVAVLGSLRR